MTKEEKQVELLNRQYVNIEYYKSLRIKIPTIFGGLLIGLMGIFLNSKTSVGSCELKLLLSFMIILLGVFGSITYRFVQKQYSDIVKDIYYLWEKLEMVGSDFFYEKRGAENKKGTAPKIFLVGYISIVLFMLIGIVLIWIY